MLQRLALFIVIILASVLGSPSVHAADVENCPAPDVTGPGSQVDEATRDLKCAASDDFSRTCAYGNFVRGEQSALAEVTTKAWVDHYARVFDPESTFGEKEQVLRDLRSALADPKFPELYAYWESLRRPSAPLADRRQETREKFTEAEIARFYRAIPMLARLESTGSLSATVELLAQLPEGELARSSPADRKALLEKIYRKGLDYRNEHSVGCSNFRASARQLNLGQTKFGKPFIGNQASKSAPLTERKAAMEASQAIAGSRRQVAGAAEALSACGNANVDVRKDVAKVHLSCDVDLPMKIFADNEPKLPTASEQALVAKIAENPCYQKALKDGLKIEKIAIATSANTLRNTKNYCKWDFENLSADRGKSIQAAITGFLGNDQIPTAINSRGTNGDGSSGPCAYVAKERKTAAEGTYAVEDLVNGVKRTRYFTEERAPKYASKAAEEALEPFKYARATIYFEDRKEPIENAPRQWTAITYCKEVRFDCVD